MERHARAVSAAAPSTELFLRAEDCAGYAVAAVAAVLVLYPVFYLLQAAFDTGDPQTRPPTAYGLDNFAGPAQLSADHAQHADGVVRRDT